MNKSIRQAIIRSKKGSLLSQEKNIIIVTTINKKTTTLYQIKYPEDFHRLVTLDPYQG